MSKKKPSGATPALAVLEAAGIEHSVSTFEGGTDHFGDAAAAALDVDSNRIFKTLVIDLTAGKGPKRQLAVACIPVTSKLSLKKRRRLRWARQKPRWRINTTPLSRQVIFLAVFLLLVRSTRCPLW